MTNYAAKRGQAHAMLKTFGSSMVLRDPGAGTFDPATGAKTGGAATDYACTGVFGSKRQSRRGEAGEVKRYTYQVYLSAEGIGIVPRAGLLLVWKAKSYRVLDVQTIAPGDVDVLYVLIVEA